MADLMPSVTEEDQFYPQTQEEYDQWLKRFGKTTLNKAEYDAWLGAGGSYKPFNDISQDYIVSEVNKANEEKQKQQAADNRAAATNNQLNLYNQAAANQSGYAQTAMQNYDKADAENKALAEREIDQNTRLTYTNRFNAERDLQNAAASVRDNMGTGFQSSGAGNFGSMVRDRVDYNDMTYWQELQNNNNAVANAYLQAVNQNNQARRDLANNVNKSLTDMQESTVANINNIAATDTEGYKNYDINATRQAVQGSSPQYMNPNDYYSKYNALSGYKPSTPNYYSGY